MFTRIILGLIFLAGIIIVGCGTDDSPVASEPVQTELDVLVSVQPLASLRVAETWTYWTTPVEIPFTTEVTGTGSDPNHNDGHAHKLAAITVEGEDILVGTAEASGISISVTIQDGMDIFQLEHGGEMHTHHAEAGDHHVVVEVAETATGHHAHGDAVVPYCEITILAIAESSGDTTEIELTGVQGGHGYRYESNAALAFDTYDLHIEVEPPSFYRHEVTQNNWTEHAEFEFHGWIFDNTSSGTIGEDIWAGSLGDSLGISLRAGSVKTYGAVGIGEIPLEGNETVNFSVKLSDPATDAHAQPLFDALVNVSVHNGSTGETVSSLLVPMWGEHGFHLARNMALNLGHVTGGEGGGDGGHGH
jgi:uncharacterized protein involved in high-affinity Fe2+ transport